ncbi:unnamed protein product, partial [Prorocentrum cordatum]
VGDNRWNKIGADTSFLELHHAVGDVDEGWREHCRLDADAGAAASANPDAVVEGEEDKRSYAYHYGRYLEKHHSELFSNYNVYSQAKRAKTKMDMHGLFEAYENYVDQHCVFSHPSLDHGTILAINDWVLTKLRDQLKNENLRPYVMMVLRLATPTDDGVDWVLKSRQDALKRVPYLLSQMKESKVFQPSLAPLPPAPVSKAAPKKRAKKGAAAKPGVAAEPKPEVFSVTTEGRAAVFLDDARNAIQYTLQCVDPSKIQEQDKFVDKMMMTCVEFGVAGKVQIDTEKGGKQTKTSMTTWSSLRKYVKKQLVDALGINCMAHVSADPDNVTSAVGKFWDVFMSPETHAAMTSAASVSRSSLAACIVEIIEKDCMPLCFDHALMKLSLSAYTVDEKKHQTELSPNPDAKSVIDILGKFMCMLLEEGANVFQAAVAQSDSDPEARQSMCEWAVIFENAKSTVAKYIAEIAANDAQCHDGVMWTRLWTSIVSVSALVAVDACMCDDESVWAAGSKMEQQIIQLLSKMPKDKAAEQYNTLKLKYDEAQKLPTEYDQPSMVKLMIDDRRATLERETTDAIKSAYAVPVPEDEQEGGAAGIVDGGAADEHNAGFIKLITAQPSAIDEAWAAQVFAAKATAELLEGWRSGEGAAAELKDVGLDILMTKDPAKQKKNPAGSRRAFVDLLHLELESLKLALVGKVSTSLVGVLHRSPNTCTVGKYKKFHVMVTTTASMCSPTAAAFVPAWSLRAIKEASTKRGRTGSAAAPVGPIMMFEPVCVEVCGAKLSVMALVPDMAYIKSLIKHKRIEMAENHEKVRQKAVKEGKAVPNAPELKHFYVELTRPELT